MQIVINHNKFDLAQLTYRYLTQIYQLRSKNKNSQYYWNYRMFLNVSALNLCHIKVWMLQQI